MRLRDAMEVGQQWVLEHGPQTPGFAGAYFAGSALWLDGDATLPASSDLDIHLVLDDVGTGLKPGKFIYRGVLLEVSHIPRDLFKSPEALLANYHLAGAFRGSSVILDPRGDLSALQDVVSRAYALRRWVEARCEHASESAIRAARALHASMPLHDQVTVCAFGAGITTHVLLVAGLENPTVRRRYAAVRDLLARHQRLDFHESLLALQGCAGMSRERVLEHLAGMTTAFDTAKMAVRTPYRFASDISDAARPISVDGTRELIEHGLHREAVFWIAATYGRCLTILAVDAPDHLLEMDPSYHALMADLGLTTYAERQRRCAQVEAFLPAVQDVAAQIMRATPGIQD